MKVLIGSFRLNTKSFRWNWVCHAKDVRPSRNLVMGRTPLQFSHLPLPFICIRNGKKWRPQCICHGMLWQMHCGRQMFPVPDAYAGSVAGRRNKNHTIAMSYFAASYLWCSGFTAELSVWEHRICTRHKNSLLMVPLSSLPSITASIHWASWVRVSNECMGRFDIDIRR